MAAAGKATLSEAFIASRQQWFLGLMLLALHAVLVFGIDSWLARGFVLTHFGLFLMWQPIWGGERNLDVRHATLIIVAGLLFAIWNSGWLMAVWIAVLFALIGGNVMGKRQRGQRTLSLLAAVYLLAVLLMWVVPHLFADIRFTEVMTLVVRYGLLLPVLAVFFIKAENEPESSQRAVDLFYSLLLFLLTAALVLGSFVIKQVSHGGYLLSLAQTLFLIAIILFALSWLWDPHSGFDGVGQLFSRYLLSVGLPFERWMHSLANLADREGNPEKFLIMSAHEIAALPWVAGVSWRATGSERKLGGTSRFPAEFSFGDLHMVLYSKWQLSPALLLHVKLLVRLLADFYNAKIREKQERQNAYTQAVYETGARLTHDVKNLLQSLKSLCTAVETGGADDAEALQKLIQRQLPQITQRLQLTMDKLKAPQKADEGNGKPAQEWWANLKQRYASEVIDFKETDISAGADLPMQLFDSIADNLLQNALQKSKLETGLRISIGFSCAPRATLSVCDNGVPLSESLVKTLFNGPVPSQNGLGVGLYQAAKQATQMGYRLRLASNQIGKVCFELSPAA
ncbi:MAG TPA: ATP-binding protein [Burkholderiales bacterium]|nr:ATP-binding protein [Burkholderiales bacterium]